MLKLERFSGINNVATDPELADPGDLQVATNVFIDNDRAIVRRPGFTRVYNSDLHSLNADTGALLCVQGTDLIRYTSPSSQTTLASGLTQNKPMGYCWLNGSLYFSNGYQKGVYQNSAVRSWGLAVPPTPYPVDIDGKLAKGMYQLAITYMRGDGQESGTSETVTCECTRGGIALHGIVPSSDTGVVNTVIYMTGAGGETVPELGGKGLRLTAIIPKTATSFEITDNLSTGLGAVCETYGTAPPPFGTIVFFYRGRMYVVSGTALYYSQPMQYENFSLDNGYVLFQHDIKVAVPVENGIWIGTTNEFMFLSGKDPVENGGFQIQSRVPFGTQTGGQQIDSSLTEARGLAPGLQAVWVANCGVCIGDSNGMMVCKTIKRWRTSTLAGGASYVDRSGGYYIFQINSTTYYMNLKNGYVTTSDRAYNSYATLSGALYGADSSGLHLASSTATDDTVGNTVTPVAAVIKKGGISFGVPFKKSITEVYLSMKTTGRMSATVRSGDSSATVTTITPLTMSNLEIKGHKLDVPRGIKGRAFEVTLNNVSGAYFVLYNVWLEVSASETRRGLQCHG